MRIKGVLFDLGGTLLDYRREEVFRALLKEQGIEVSSEEVARAYDAVEPEWNRRFASYQDSVKLNQEALKEGTA